MNAAEFSDLLGKLPGDMLADAFQNTNLHPQAEHDKSAELSGSALPISRPDDKISAPRWITAAALAACMLFAVGVGALLLRGQRDDLTTQSSLADSSVPETVTACLTETTVPVTTVSEPYYTSGTRMFAAESQTAAEETVTVYTTGVNIPEETTEQDTETAPPETTALTVTTAAETLVQTTTTVVPHLIMQMTSAEEVEREGLRMVGEYKRRLAQLRGELAGDAPRITLDEVMQMIGSGMDYRSVAVRLAELYPYPDYYGGSGISMTQYWLDDSGNDYILLIHEQQEIVHVARGREENLYEKLLSEEGKP